MPEVKLYFDPAEAMSKGYGVAAEPWRATCGDVDVIGESAEEVLWEIGSRLVDLRRLDAKKAGGR
jgi:hypothetical protein